MKYAVSVDAQIASGGPELDPLHRVGVVALLERGFESVEAIDGPDGVEVEVLDTFVGVHPGGALMKVFVDAPMLELAEEAVRSLVDELLERSELLAEWTIARCAVELHADLAKESLDAALGPGAPPDDLASRRARLSGQDGPGTTAEAPVDAVDALAMRETFDALADRLRAFGSEDFGGPATERAGEGANGSAGSAGSSRSGGRGGDGVGLVAVVSTAEARLAAGALVYGMDLLLDELFQDVCALDEDGGSVADCDEPMWLLDELPRRYALRYDARFARRFLVTAIALTTRFTQDTFERLSCVAEELALRLLLREAEIALDLFGLLDDGVALALECFADAVYEDMNHEWLYDDSMDGIDESPVGAYLGVAPMGIARWFTPFDPERYVHPYAADDPEADPDPDTDPELSSALDPDLDAELDEGLDADIDTAPDTTPDTEPGPTLGSAPHPEPGPEPHPEPGPEPATDPDTEAGSGSTSDVHRGSDPDAASGPDADHRGSDPDADLGSDSGTPPSAGSASGSEGAPGPGADADPDADPDGGSADPDEGAAGPG
ncbi:hypothetical protein [Streptomyces sp. NPDC057702]|uniref:hypothetical protein n=1 Tax=unclassified Streptomyces TaxID=2593676 RepID=UPI003688AEC9